MSDTIAEILLARRVTHGDYTSQAKTACQLRAIISEMDHGLMNCAQLDALNMICVKISRIVNGDPNVRDHWDDIAGYARLAADRCNTRS